ncbi:hypothetical protein EK21DRAFT_111747 [Setomelanomma holmii]|uniref:Uncharacterized protein n=1 Tax=Setomelanomma holmii TaxID=210430 RepID=A0A9P4H9B3_9PLEO|nr:hypothetical protein EK21DRAFT_111747 [Setomelanomma holmii]
MSASTDRRMRSVFDKSLCTVYSYPSTGGIILKLVAGVELDFLGLSRIDTTLCDNDHTIEDAFAFRMLKIGARWWPSLASYKRHCDVQYPYGHHYPADLHVGYLATGGVFILETFAEIRRYD